MKCFLVDVTQTSKILHYHRNEHQRGELLIMEQQSMKFCHSCCMPLNTPESQSKNELYCVYCANENGTLKEWDEILAGATNFIASWQHIPLEEAKKRAVRMLSSMPAWADKINPI